MSRAKLGNERALSLEWTGIHAFVLFPRTIRYGILVYSAATKRGRMRRLPRGRGHVYDISFVQEGGEGDLWAKPGQSEHEECLDDDTNKWKKDILHIMAREKRLSCLHVGRGQQPHPQF